MVSGVICFGDSILAGTGALSRENGCAKILKRSLSIPVSLKGINRNTTQDGLMRLQQDVIDQKHLSHVVILFGNNDCRLTDAGQSFISEDRFLANLEEMERRIKQNQQMPLFCNLQPIDAQKLYEFAPDYKKQMADPENLQAKYNSLVEAFTKRSGNLLIDIRTPLNSQKAKVMANDGLHPNDLGHEIIAHQILKSLKQLDSLLEIVRTG
jgi:lysophospholipase L1-like esterase